MAQENKIRTLHEPLADNAKRLREAAKQMVGQADRTNHLFVDVLLDMVERIEQMEGEIERWRAAERRAMERAT